MKTEFFQMGREPRVGKSMAGSGGEKRERKYVMYVYLPTLDIITVDSKHILINMKNYFVLQWAITQHKEE